MWSTHCATVCRVHSVDNLRISNRKSPNMWVVSDWVCPAETFTYTRGPNRSRFWTPKAPNWSFTTRLTMLVTMLLTWVTSHLEHLLQKHGWINRWYSIFRRKFRVAHLSDLRQVKNMCHWHISFDALPDTPNLDNFWNFHSRLSTRIWSTDAPTLPTDIKFHMNYQIVTI